MLDGVDGAKKCVSAHLCSLNLTPYVKIATKMSFEVVNKTVSFVTQQEVTFFKKIIKETPMELVEEYVKNINQSRSIFHATIKNIENLSAEKQRQLSQPIRREKF